MVATVVGRRSTSSAMAPFIVQDIAVDGWALTLLRPEHIEYASTCQTLGMNIGYFTSFTAFLALNNPEFCNKYVRAHEPLQGERGVAVLAVSLVEGHGGDLPP